MINNHDMRTLLTKKYILEEKLKDSELSETEREETSKQLQDIRKQLQ